MHNDLTLTAAAAVIAAGDISSERLVRDCLDRIEERDPVIHAWAFVDPELALAQARSCDRAPDRLGPLHGVPIGVKDIIETADVNVGTRCLIIHIHLEAAGLTADERGRLKVNADYQTSCPHIYAVGDVIGFPSLASTS